MSTEDLGTDGQQGTENQQQGASSTDGKESSGATSAAGDEFKAITSQAELNRIIADRVKRAEAKYAGHADALKKAAEFDKITEAQKTELQKIQDRAEAAEKRAADLEAAEQKRVADAEAAKQVEGWKAAVSKKSGVPVSVLRGNTEEDIQAHADSLKEAFPPPDPRRGAYVPSEGRSGGTGGADPRQQFAEILKNA